MPVYHGRRERFPTSSICLAEEAESRRRGPRRRRAAKSPEEDPSRRRSGKRGPLPSPAARPPPVPDPVPALGKPAWLLRPGASRARNPEKGAPGAGRATARIESTGPRGGGRGAPGVVPDAGDGARNWEGCEGPRRGQRASCVERKRRPRRHLQPGSGHRATPGPEGQGGGGPRVKTAAGPWRDGGKPRPAPEPVRRMQPGCRAAGQGAGLRRGPQWARRPPGAMQQLHLAAGLRRPARAGHPPGTAARLGAERERGQDRAARAAAARTHQSAVPPPEPGLHSELHGPAAPGLSGAPVPHYPARSGASDAASGPATAAATPPPGGGPGRIWRGAQPGSANQGRLTRPLLQDWRAPRPMGRRQGRRASAPRGGGLR